jgi:tRNA pseudouridine55 synthase
VSVVAARRARRRIDGVLLVDKPAGMTSNAVLQGAKRLLDADKAGHTGTLDPFATGLLPLCFGDATKFAQALLGARKTYVATVRFGVTTTTGDVDGEVVAESAVALTRQAIEAALPHFRGSVMQVPPMHSALKRDGRAYYEYARRGITLEREPRAVVVDRLELVDWRTPQATLAVTCGKGTYVRVLAEDLGAALGCGAHLVALRRTACAGFDVRDAATLDALADEPVAMRDRHLLPVASLLGDLPALSLSIPAAVQLGHGQAVSVDVPAGRYRCMQDDRLLGTGRVDGGALRAERLCRADTGTAAAASAAELGERVG